MASAATIIRAVSRMSWLVAPRCTQPAAASSCSATSRASQAASGTTGLPEAAAAAPSSSGSYVDPGGDAGDQACGHVGRQAHLRLRRGQRALGSQHRRDQGAVADDLVQRGVAGQVRRAARRTGAQRAKKTVSCSPWRWMSNRSVPSGSATATSVCRRSGSTADSTGSAALASASSGK